MKSNLSENNLPSPLSSPGTLILTSPIPSTSASVTPKSKEQKPITIYDCTTSVYLTARLFGLLSFSIEYDSNGHMKRALVSIFDAIIFVSSIVFHIATIIIFCSSQTDVDSGDTQTNALLAGGRFTIIYSLISAIVSMVWDMVTRNSLIEIIKDFHEFDKKVRIRIRKRFFTIKNYFFPFKQIEAFGVFIDYRKHKQFTIKCYLVSIIIIVLCVLVEFTQVKWIQESQSIFFALTYYFAYTLINGSLLLSFHKYHNLLQSICCRYRKINALMR